MEFEWGFSGGEDSGGVRHCGVWDGRMLIRCFLFGSDIVLGSLEGVYIHPRNLVANPTR